MKQETLEEAANNYAILGPWQCPVSFIKGAEWQKESTHNSIELYSEIEHLIIAWNIDGTKTAGALTRDIMELLKK